MNHQSRNNRGQALLMGSLAIMAMMGMVGLAIDLGFNYYTKTAAQAAAESAALAIVEATLQANGGGSFVCGVGGVVCQANTACPGLPTTPPSSAIINGCLYARTNGFSASGAQNVMVASGGAGVPPTAPGLNAKYWATVRVSQKVPQLFSALLGNTDSLVSARATAAVVAGQANACIYVLDPTAANSFSASGGAQIHAPCGVNVDSNSTTAMNVSGGATVNAAPGSVNVVGTAVTSGGGSITPAANNHSSSFADPLASMPTPTFNPTCNHTSYSVSVTTTILSPGTYCNGMTISGGANVTFLPGVYVLEGGSFNVSGNSSVTGTGVTFLMTGNGTYSMGAVTLSGGTVANLNAPTTGALQNILFFQDRTKSGPVQTFSGGATVQLFGILYFPTTDMNYSGGSSSKNVDITIISKTINFSGNAWIAQSNVSGSAMGSQVALVE